MPAGNKKDDRQKEGKNRAKSWPAKTINKKKEDKEDPHVTMGIHTHARKNPFVDLGKRKKPKEAGSRENLLEKSS
jgi:hypothetical protein